MAIVKQYHRDTDTIYVYESTSYWDESKKQSRSKRRLIGKVDPVTGETIPTGKRGRKKKEEPISPSGTGQDPSVDGFREEIRELTECLKGKTARISELEAENRELKDTITRVRKLLIQASLLCGQESR